jgi:type II secretory pathway predicted ATPase ExeA
MGLVSRLLDRFSAGPRSTSVVAESAGIRDAGFAAPLAPLSQDGGLRDAFTPTRPQRTARRLAGRETELLRIFRAIGLERAHVVLYGERGRGKTSLVNLVAAAARRTGFMVGRHACSFDSTFDDIVRGLARDLPASLLANPAVADPNLEGCEAALPAGRVQPRDVVALPGRLIGPRLLLIADEFDRVQDSATRTLFADTVKQVSDRGVPLSFIIVGVADSLEELLGRHPSIQRNILGLPLPLLPDEQIAHILVQGGAEAGVAFDAQACAAIAAVARGVPYIAQLLGLHAATEALQAGSRSVRRADVLAACARAVEEADPRAAGVYEELTRGGRDRALQAVLTQVARAAQDRFGRFTAIDSEQAGVVRLGDASVKRDAWAMLRTAGAIRPCPNAGPDIFTFADPLLPHYILLRAVLDEAAQAPVRSAAPSPLA